MLLFVITNLIILLSISFLVNSLSIFATGFFCLVTILILNKKITKVNYNHLLIIFIVSIAFMLILYFGYLSKYGTPYYIGGSDDLSFEKNALHFINRGYIWPSDLFNESIFYFYPAKGFVWFLGNFIQLSSFFGGYHTLAFRVFNIYILLILGMLVFDYFKSNYSFKTSQNLIFLYSFALFPNSLFITSHVFRDTFNAFVLFFIFFIWDKYITSSYKKTKYLIVILLLTSLLAWFSYWMREQNIIFLSFTILILTILRNKVLKLKKIAKITTLFLSIVFLFYIFDVIGTVNKFNEYYDNYLAENIEGLSASIFSISLIPYGIFIRAIYALVSPFPGDILRFNEMFTDIDSFFRVIISIGVIAQFFLLPYLFMNIKKIDKIGLLFSIYFIGSILFTFTFRHFILIYPFMAILIFRMFYNTKYKTRLLLFMIQVFLLALLGSTYLIIR